MSEKSTQNSYNEFAFELQVITRATLWIPNHIESFRGPFIRVGTIQLECGFVMQEVQQVQFDHIMTIKYS